MKAGGCAARRQWRRVEQPARKTERHLEVRRHDVSLLLGLGGYTYNSLKPRGLFHTSGCSPRSRGGMLSFLSASPLPSLVLLKQELAMLPKCLKIEVLC